MKDIIVFGMGKYFECKRETIERKYNIALFLDNKAEKNFAGTYGDASIKVMSPNEADREDTRKIFLMSVHFVSMWKQLCKIGIAPERLVFPYAEKPFFENDAELDNILERIEFSKEYFVCVLKDKSTVRITDEKEWRNFLREAYRRRYPLIEAVALMNASPISRQFGTERGTPVDRFYIDQFLQEHKKYIYGDVLEIEDNSYTVRYGGGRVSRSIVMDVGSKNEKVAFNANLESGDGIRDEIADCFICTQTLMYIFNLKNAVHNIGRLLKKGGAALITCSGISQNSIRCMDNYGCYFNFNEAALRRIFETESSLKVIETGSFGNAKTVLAHLGGLCLEDLKADDFLGNDKCYPLIVYAVVEKLESSFC